MSPSTGPRFQAATGDGHHNEEFVNDNDVTLVVTPDKKIAKTGVAPANTSSQAANQGRARLKACRL